VRQGVSVAIATLVIIAFAGAPVAVGAEASLPKFEGLLSFPAIHGPSDPEEFAWEVELGEGQELEQVDSQHAMVYYTEGHQPALGITAEQAHDAEGSSVPTSLEVSKGNVITLSVHHRAGNPAAGGVPFVYPVVAGAGWEGGFHTGPVGGPPDEQEFKEEQERIAREKQEALERERGKEGPGGCHVPRLKGKSLRASKKLLKRAECLIGRVGKLKGATAKAGKVVSQSPKPGTLLGPWGTVQVTLGR
jgi:hypothetical protein